MAKSSNVIVKSFGKSGFEAPPQLLEREGVKRDKPMPEPHKRLLKAHGRGSFWQGIALGMLVGIVACEALNIAITAAQFEQVTKAVFQADVAHRILDKTTD